MYKATTIPTSQCWASGVLYAHVCVQFVLYGGSLFKFFLASVYVQMKHEKHVHSTLAK